MNPSGSEHLIVPLRLFTPFRRRFSRRCGTRVARLGVRQPADLPRRVKSATTHPSLFSPAEKIRARSVFDVLPIPQTLTHLNNGGLRHPRHPEGRVLSPSLSGRLNLQWSLRLVADDPDLSRSPTFRHRAQHQGWDRLSLLTWGRHWDRLAMAKSQKGKRKR